MNSAQQIFRHSAFQADANPEALDDLQAAYLNLRKDCGERMISLCSQFGQPDHCQEVVNELRELQRQVPNSSNTLFDDPVFMAWVNFMTRAVDRQANEEVRSHCQNLPSVLRRVRSRMMGEMEFYVPGTDIALQQYNMDPYIQTATPPSYDFTKKEKAPEGDANFGHPLRMQQELMGMAMRNIETAWPELYRQILSVVKIVGYLPDATFRSCSAARYAGVVYLGNMDERLLDIEESIVHEAGHQVLYRLGEIVGLVRQGVPQSPDYELPWSGSKRDLFGFLHAFYIYTLLTKYFWRRAAVNTAERSDCVQRAVLIMIGNHLAIPMLIDDPGLTDQGRTLVRVLAREMDVLQQEIEASFSPNLIHNG